MKGAKAPLYPVREIKDLRDMLKQSVELYGEKDAFLVKKAGNRVYQGISFKQFDEDVRALGTALLEMGLGDARIAVIGENRYEWALTYMTVVNGVGVIVPLDKELPAEETIHLIKVSEAKMIVYADKYEVYLEEVKREVPGLEHFVNMDKKESDEVSFSLAGLIARGKELLAAGDNSYDEREIDPEVMSILLFTSGTTGMAKGVMLSHTNIAANLMAMCQMVYIDDKDTFLSVLPIHHSYECTCGYLCQVYRGSTIAYCEGLRYITDNMAEAKATMMLGVPLLFESMYRKVWKSAEKSGSATKLRKAIKVNNKLKKIGIDLSKKLFAPIHAALGGHVRLFISGAAAIDPEVAAGFNDLGIKLIQGYGLTECAPIVALNRDVNFKHDSAGLVMPGVEIKIHNPDVDGIGEIVCRGKNVMLGYYDNQEATDEVLKDGWFYTGDLASIDEDGFIHIAGREKNVIVTKNGKNIFPEEVETYLCRSEYVAECMVWGKLDERAGEIRVNAMIVPDYEAVEELLGENYSEDDLNKLLKQEITKTNHQMPFYKRVADYTIRKEEFIKTTTKKIKRHLV